MRTPEDALNEAVAYLAREVAPRAEAIDHDPEELRIALRGLCDRNLMAMKRPHEFGGPAMSEPLFRQFQEAVAKTSGALAFLQTQHQSAVSMLSRADNVALKAEVLPEMGDGSRLIGIGFSQLRRPGPPIMRAEQVEGGYMLEGHVPWVTGWNFYPEFLVGAQFPDGRAVFAIVPLQSDEGLTVSAPMRLAAMESANTVTVDFESYFLPADRVAFVKPEGWIRNNDQINIALQGHFAIGCAEAGIEIVRSAAARRGSTFAATAAEALHRELEELREATIQAQKLVGEESTEDRLRIRAWAIEFCGRCAHSAVAASGGAANAVSHPAQRVLRESLVFAVSAQTVPIMEATLRRLISRSPDTTLGP